MRPRERFFSEKIAELAWKIPGLNPFKAYRFQEWVTKKERQNLGVLEKEVLQRLPTLASGQNTGVGLGFRGPMRGFRERLIGEDGRGYGCTVVADEQRLEVEVVDIPKADGPIRKYRVFVGKFEINGERITYDLSGLYDKPFSWRRNFSDNDYPQKGLTLKESHQFMKEISNACPEKLQSPPSTQLFELK